MNFSVRFTEEARDELKRLHEFKLEQAGGDFRQADAALDAIRRGIAMLQSSPFACRPAAGADVMLRELLIGFGATGYVALFEIEDAQTVTVVAVRHQREDDYR